MLPYHTISSMISFLLSSAIERCDILSTSTLTLGTMLQTFSQFQCPISHASTPIVTMIGSQ